MKVLYIGSTLIISAILLLGSVILLEKMTQNMGLPLTPLSHPGETGVSPDRCVEAFDQDIETVLSDCSRLYPEFDSLPEEAQQIIANMMFNLGYPRLSKFKGMKRGVDSQNWNEAADEMVDSRWYNQVGARAERLVARMRDVS